MINNDYSKDNSNYLQANPTWHVEDSAWKATQILQMLERNKLQPKSVVEIGCGAGEILNQLQQRMTDKAIQFSGYEIAPDAFKLAQTREKENLHFYCEDFLQNNNSYDLLLMIDVFEHVDDYIGFIKKCSTKAGYKIFHIPLDISLWSVLTNYPASARKQVGHLHYFTTPLEAAPVARPRLLVFASPKFELLRYSGLIRASPEIVTFPISNKGLLGGSKFQYRTRSGIPRVTVGSIPG